MRETPSNATHIEGDDEHSKLTRKMGSRRCNCVKKEDDDQDQGFAMDATYSPNLIVRQKPLALSSGYSPPASPRERNLNRALSSESTSQRSLLQANFPGSFIFERNVQEDILLPQTSPSIPSHIRTEDHIPPVLEASSAAITDNGLDPDSVEIVTHNIHHPATNGVPAEQSFRSPSLDNVAMNIGENEELPLTGQNPEASDIRRLSFISFADVVNAENADTGDYPPSNDSLQKGTGSPIPSVTVFRNMSPSPLCSPASSHGFGTSPPTSISTSFKGLELSQNRGAPGAESPRLAVQRPVSPSHSGDLNIETMSQALRRTGSGDLGASRIQPSNTVASDD